MAKGRVVFYEESDRSTAPPRTVYTNQARRQRRKRRRRGRRLLFALALLVVVSSVGYVLWYTHSPADSVISDADRDQVESDTGGFADSTDLTAAAPMGALWWPLTRGMGASTPISAPRTTAARPTACGKVK